jgi:hypothetical protein
MKKFWAAVAVIAVVAGSYLFLRSKNPSSENPPPQSGNIAETNSNVPSVPGRVQSVPSLSSTGVAANVTAPNDLSSRAASPNPAPGSVEITNEVASLPPLTVLDKARVVMLNYRSAFGENPVGTNPEITEALMGKNPKKINFVTPDSGLRVNEKGEMLDGYGTPFFFHQISGQEMEIRSAGRDRIMWTPDDLVTR